MDQYIVYEGPEGGVYAFKTSWTPERPYAEIDDLVMQMGAKSPGSWCAVMARAPEHAETLAKNSGLGMKVRPPFELLIGRKPEDLVP